MENKKETKTIAEVGTKVTYNKKEYTLRNEIVTGGCKGCALYKVVGCPDNITSLCRQGFILQS